MFRCQALKVFLEPIESFHSHGYLLIISNLMQIQWQLHSIGSVYISSCWRGMPSMAYAYL
ncbi:hypothetical protein BDF14DRAFT_1773963 [Spinellus fusiger]|nr:hypothetical protein BDF14DRAFT_1773963 [Spinellus fusiger]